MRVGTLCVECLRERKILTQVRRIGVRLYYSVGHGDCTRYL
nr:hypothetical protein [Pseudomonas baetica]